MKDENEITTKYVSLELLYDLIERARIIYKEIRNLGGIASYGSDWAQKKGLEGELNPFSKIIDALIEVEKDIRAIQKCTNRVYEILFKSKSSSDGELDYIKLIESFVELYLELDDYRLMEEAKVLLPKRFKEFESERLKSFRDAIIRAIYGKNVEWILNYYRTYLLMDNKFKHITIFLRAIRSALIQRLGDIFSEYTIGQEPSTFRKKAIYKIVVFADVLLNIYEECLKNIFHTSENISNNNENVLRYIVVFGDRKSASIIPTYKLISLPNLYMFRIRDFPIFCHEVCHMELERTIKLLNYLIEEHESSEKGVYSMFNKVFNECKYTWIDDPFMSEIFKKKKHIENCLIEIFSDCLSLYVSGIAYLPALLNAIVGVTPISGISKATLPIPNPYIRIGACISFFKSFLENGNEYIGKFYSFEGGKCSYIKNSQIFNKIRNELGGDGEIKTEKLKSKIIDILSSIERWCKAIIGDYNIKETGINLMYYEFGEILGKKIFNGISNILSRANLDNLDSKKHSALLIPNLLYFDRLSILGTDMENHIDAVTHEYYELDLIIKYVKELEKRTKKLS